MSPKEAMEVLPKPVRQTLAIIGGIIGIASAVLFGYIGLEHWVIGKAEAVVEQSVRADIKALRRDMRQVKRALKIDDSDDEPGKKGE